MSNNGNYGRSKSLILTVSLPAVALCMKLIWNIFTKAWKWPYLDQKDNDKTPEGRFLTNFQSSIKQMNFICLIFAEIGTFKPENLSQSHQKTATFGPNCQNWKIWSNFLFKDRLDWCHNFSGVFVLESSPPILSSLGHHKRPLSQSKYIFQRPRKFRFWKWPYF